MGRDEKLEYIGCDLKKLNGRWLMLAKFRGSSGYYDWAPKWAPQLDRLYASAYLVELLNEGRTLKGFEQIYEMLNQGVREALDKAEAEAKEVDKHEIERLRLNWKQVFAQAPEYTKRTATTAILRSAGTKPVAIVDNTVILAFRYPIHKVKMEEPENQQIAEQIISNFLGHPCHVICICEPEDDHLLRVALKMGTQIINTEEKDKL